VIRRDLRRALAEELSQAGEEERSRFGDEVIVWLAVAPAWPESIAIQCDFPGDLMVIGPELEGAGLAQRAVVTDAHGDDETHWWMPSAVRRETVAAMQRRDGGEGLIKTATHVAERMGAIRARLPPALTKWARLASDPPGADRRLHESVTLLVTNGDTAEALAWVEAARFAAAVLRGALMTGIVLAERQIELAYRREHDKKLLTSFLERPFQVGWVERLLEAPDEAWALHLLGVGGVGKTMLLRFVTAKLAPDRGLVAVRIDFDHLSPDYPVRRPGQLVAALAGELRLHATVHRQANRFDRLNETMMSLAEAMSAELPPADPLANVRRPELDRLLALFADIVRALPEPVLFILDTCEELAKLLLPGGPAGSGPRAPPAVEATFEILEKLHEKVPSLRVLFAGRRFLASKGRGWEALARDSEGAAALPERRYLALEELRGFDEAEADDLFGKVYGLTLDGAQRSAVLERSREVATSRVRRADHAHDDEVARYHPFDLALYAGWIKDDPHVEPAVLAGGADPYVELRILGRIEHGAVRAAVPTLVLLRRFDRAMAAAALGLHGDDEKLGGTLRRIADQEWIDVQPDDETGALFYELHRALWPRLARFYASGARRSELDETKRRVGPALEALARSTEPAKLRAECVDAALRALTPKAGGALWSTLEERAANEGVYERLRAISERLLAEDGAASAGTPLRAHVLATYLGIEMRVAAGPGRVAAQWKEVLVSAGDVPDPETKEWLYTRSRVLGWSAAAVPVNELLAYVTRDTETESSSSAFRLATLRAALTTALDRVLETTFVPSDSVRVMSRWSEALASRKAPIDLIAPARLLAARAAAMEKSWDKADSLFDQAIAEAAIADKSPKTPRLDGRAPPSYEVRARLERASFMPLLEVGSLPAPQEPDPTGERGRLLAHAILYSLAHGCVHVGPEKLTLGAALLHTQAFGPLSSGFFPIDLLPPRSRAARQVPPRHVAIARLLTAIGQPKWALEGLDQVIQTALKAGDAAFAVRIAEREKLRVFRRYRVPPGELVDRLASANDFDAKHEARAYLAIWSRTPLRREADDLELDVGWSHDREHVGEIARKLLRAGGFDLPGQRRTWLESLPHRFVAELALEEGELLALESPERGGALLAHARAAFRRADDPVGVLFASLLGMEAEVNAKGHRDALRVLWLDHVQPAYESVRVPLQLPRLHDMAPRIAEARSDDPWRTWLERIHPWSAELADEAAKKRDESSVLFSLASLVQKHAEHAEHAAPHPVAQENISLFVSNSAKEAPSAPLAEVKSALPAPEPVGSPMATIIGEPTFFNAGGSGPPPSPEKPTEEKPAGGFGAPPLEPSDEAPITARPTAAPIVPPEIAAYKATAGPLSPPDLPHSMARRPAGAIALAGFAIAGLVYLIYHFSWGVPGAPTIPWAWALGALGAGAALFGAYRAGRSLLTRPPPPPSLPRPPIAKDLKAGPERKPKHGPALVTIAETHEAGICITISRGDGGNKTWTIALPDVAAPYDRLLADPPEDLTRALAALRTAPMVTIDISTSRLAGPAWEALVPARDDLQVGTPASAKRCVLRTRSGSSLRRASGRSALLASPRWTPLATTALRLANPVVLDVGAQTTGADRAVVVIGQPLVTSAGLVLHVAPSDESAEPEGAARTRRGELLRPGVHPLFEASIVVLVAEPVESLERSGSERTQAAELRELAHGIAQQSGVVIVVPALPTPVTRGVLEIVAKWLVNENGLDRDALVNLAIGIRTAILTYSGANELDTAGDDGRAEASLDVVMYVAQKQKRSLK
jgi:hypothetical protein